jgi:eukaryotic-like serine/threonine-protein kinase
MSDPSNPLIGMLVSGRYRVQRLLGEGGMGQVYLAEHEAIEKKIALKVLRPEYSLKPDIVARFQQEAISASRIKHPNVLDVFDFGRLDNDCFFLAMEFLEGNDLADEIVQHRVLDPLRGLRISLQVCRALGAAHARGVVHRDLKPENVFLQRTADGEMIVKIVDFGIAQLRSTEEAAATEPKRRRLTKTGMIFGTPEYMAPEQAGGRNSDLRVDVYALGVIMYEMFTGAVPFTGDTFVGVLTRQLNDPPPHMVTVCPDLRISPELQAVIMTALAKQPEQRHQSMTAFSQAILDTPEGRMVGGASVSIIPQQPASQVAGVPSSHATAAQFGTPQANVTAAQFGGHPPPPAAPLPPDRVRATTPLTDAQRAEAESMARAQTQLEAETTAPTQPPKKSSAAAVVAVIALGVLVAGGAVGMLALRSGPAPVASAEPTATPAPEPKPANSTISVTPTVPPSASAAPAQVKLSVVTDPEGAVVTKDGFQVCDKTPCEVMAAPNETLALEAKKGALRGTAKVLAQRDQKVEIKLKGTESKPKPQAGGEKPCLRERMQGDIKVVEVVPCPK